MNKIANPICKPKVFYWTSGSGFCVLHGRGKKKFVDGYYRICRYFSAFLSFSKFCFDHLRELCSFSHKVRVSGYMGFDDGTILGKIMQGEVIQLDKSVLAKILWFVLSQE